MAQLLLLPRHCRTRRRATPTSSRRARTTRTASTRAAPARRARGGRRRRRRGRGHQTPLPGPAALLLPQEDPTPACKKTCIPGYATPFASDEKKAKTAYNVPSNVAQIQAEIQARGPVTAAFTVYQVSGSAPRGSPPRSQPPRCPCHRRTS